MKRFFCSLRETLRKNLRIRVPCAGHVSSKCAMSASRSSQMSLAHELWRQFLPLEYLRMHAHDQHLFVIRAVEDADASALRQAFDVAPHEIVVEFLARRLLEREDLAALRIYAGHDVFDRAVLAGRIHRLKMSSRTSGPARRAFPAPRRATRCRAKHFGCFPFVHFQSASVGGIEIFQSEILALGDPERLYVFLDRSRISCLAIV